VWGFPELQDEDHLGDFPLSWKVTMEQYSIVKLGEIMEAEGGHFFENRAGDKVITRGFMRRKVMVTMFDLFVPCYTIKCKRVNWVSGFCSLFRNPVILKREYYQKLQH
jgi:hypothetical protein